MDWTDGYQTADYGVSPTSFLQTDETEKDGKGPWVERLSHEERARCQPISKAC
jgi:hypothetical protein